MIFSQNEIIEGISNTVMHINTIKGDNMEKLINILVKIHYFNYEKWKKILEEYILHLSIYADTNYLFYTPKEISQIIVHLKSLEEAIINGKDAAFDNINLNSKISKVDFLALLKQAVDKSSQCFLNDLETKKVEFSVINVYMVVMAKYKLLDEKICRKIENSLMPLLDGLSDFDICTLMFNMFKNKVSSEKFFVKIEKKVEALLSDFLAERKTLDPYLVTMIAKGR